MLTEEQSKRYDEVLAWPAEQRRDRYVEGVGAAHGHLRAVTYVSAGELLSDEVILVKSSADGVPGVCPVIGEYAELLVRMIREDLLWQSGKMAMIFGTENKETVDRRRMMIAKFYENCLKRSEIVPTREQDGSARHETALAQAWERSGLAAAAMTLGMQALAREASKDVVAANMKMVVEHDKVFGARWYAIADDDPAAPIFADLFTELQRGTLWLFEEMCALR